MSLCICARELKIQQRNYESFIREVGIHFPAKCTSIIIDTS